MNQRMNVLQVSFPTQTFVEDVKLVPQARPFYRNCRVPLNTVFTGRGRRMSNFFCMYYQLQSSTNTIYQRVAYLYVVWKPNLIVTDNWNDNF